MQLVLFFPSCDLLSTAACDVLFHASYLLLTSTFHGIFFLLLTICCKFFPILVFYILLCGVSSGLTFCFRLVLLPPLSFFCLSLIFQFLPPLPFYFPCVTSLLPVLLPICDVSDTPNVLPPICDVYNTCSASNFGLPCHPYDFFYFRFKTSLAHLMVYFLRVTCLPLLPFYLLLVTFLPPIPF